MLLSLRSFAYGEACFYERPQEVGALLLVLVTTGFWLCRLSAWIITSR